MSEETAATAELRAALAAALDDLEWRRTNEHAAARMIGETIAELLAQYEFAVSGLRAAREKIAALEADAAALRVGRGPVGRVYAVL